MTKIVGIIRPNGYKQQFFVYQDGNKIQEFDLFLNEFDNTIKHYLAQFDATQVDLIGPKQYTKGLIKNISKEEQNINFNLL